VIAGRENKIPLLNLYWLGDRGNLNRGSTEVPQIRQELGFDNGTQNGYEASEIWSAQDDIACGTNYAYSFLPKYLPNLAFLE
jgi:hypothetical protein